MTTDSVFDQAAVVVIRAGTMPFASYRGFANRETSEPISASTKFQIASISKSFTATATLLLVDAGALTLHDSIARSLPGCPPSWKPITIHQLLTHTSGLGHWPFYPELDLLKPIDPAHELAIFQSRPLVFDAGTGWAYSSPGYVLLAYLVQQVAGQPYRRFLEERILERLTLHDTVVGNASGDPARARGYEHGLAAEPFELDTVGKGAGDLWATAEDLARWMSLLAQPSILPLPLHQLMLTRHAQRISDAVDPLPPSHYGYGVSFGEVAGEPMIFHTGHNPGFRSVAGFLPERGAAFAYLSNEETADLSAVMHQLLAIVVASR